MKKRQPGSSQYHFNHIKNYFQAKITEFSIKVDILPIFKYNLHIKDG